MQQPGSSLCQYWTPRPSSWQKMLIFIFIFLHPSLTKPKIICRMTTQKEAETSKNQHPVTVHPEYCIVPAMEAPKPHRLCVWVGLSIHQGHILCPCRHYCSHRQPNSIPGPSTHGPCLRLQKHFCQLPKCTTSHIYISQAKKPAGF